MNNFFIHFTILNWAWNEENEFHYKVHCAVSGSNWIVNYTADLYWDLFHLIFSLSFFFVSWSFMSLSFFRTTHVKLLWKMSLWNRRASIKASVINSLLVSHIFNFFFSLIHSGINEFYLKNVWLSVWNEKLWKIIFGSASFFFSTA